jgi:hypothetical protein
MERGTHAKQALTSQSCSRILRTPSCACRQGRTWPFHADFVVHLHKLEVAIAPRVDGASPETILIHQTNVFKDVPLQVMGLKNKLVLIRLADLTLDG